MFDKSDEEHWYALKVFYNRVFDVERLLAQDGVKTYIPLRSTETTVGGRTIRRREPAVSSLMFVRQAERAVLELMQRAKATSPLMVYFDRETKKPAVIPDPEMEAFMLVTSTDDPGLDTSPKRRRNSGGATGSALQRVFSKGPKAIFGVSRATGG